LGLTIRRLERSDVRDGFESGSLALDRFLREFAWQNQERYALGVTYVAVDEATRLVCGYVTVSGAQLTADQRFAAGVPRAFEGGVPVLRLGCLAVDRRFQGQGLGRELLAHVFRMVVAHSREVGCVGLVVDARPDAVAFYERHRFERVGAVEGGAMSRPRTTPMFLALRDIRAALT